MERFLWGVMAACVLLAGNRPPDFCRGTGRQPAPHLARAAAGEWEVTDETEIRLDGRPCRYADVPASALVERIDLAKDGRTVLRLWFRSKP